MAQVQINLLTKEFRGTGTSAVDGVANWIIILGIIGFIGVGGWQFVDYYRLSGEQASVGADISSLQTKATEIQKLKTVEDNIKKFQELVKKTKASNPSMVEMLAGIQANTPAGIAITNLNVNAEGVELRVEASNLAEVEKYIDSLRQVKLFPNVALQSLAQEGDKPIQAGIAVKFNNNSNNKGGQPTNEAKRN